MSNETKSTTSASSILLALIFALIFFVAAWYLPSYFYLNDTNQRVTKMQWDYEHLKSQNDKNAELKQTPAELEQMIADAERQYKSVLPIIPKDSEIPEIMNWIEASAFQREMKLAHFSRSTQVKEINGITEVPIDIELMCNYGSAKHFLQDIAHYNRAMNVTRVELEQNPLVPSEQALQTGVVPSQPDHSKLFATYLAKINLTAFVAKEKTVDSK